MTSVCYAGEVTVRAAVAEDAAAVARIYNQGIAERQATFETRPREAAEVEAWLRDGRPFLVAVDGYGTVLGWARVMPYSDRPVHHGIGDYAVYVDAEDRGRGLGRLLLDELAVAARAAGLYKLTSRIFTTNAASLATARTCGFREVGVQHRHGTLDGEWRDCVLVERLLGPAAR